MKKIFNILSVLISIVLTIVLTIFIIMFTMILNANNYFSKTNISRIMGSTDVSKVIYYADKDFYDNLTNTLKLAGVNESVSKEILNGEKLKKTVTDYIVSVYDSVIYDNEVKEITKKELVSVVEEAIDTVNKNTDNSISNKEKGIILDLVSDSSEIIIGNLPTRVDILKAIDNEDIILLLRSILRVTAIMGQFMIIVVLISIIGIIRWSYYKWLGYLGTSTCISGLVYMALYFVFTKMDMIIELDNELLEYIADIMLNNLASNFFISSIILFIITIFTFVLLNTVKKSLNKKGEDGLDEKELQNS